MSEEAGAAGFSVALQPVIRVADSSMQRVVAIGVRFIVVAPLLQLVELTSTDLGGNAMREASCTAALPSSWPRAYHNMNH
jgi:hypothetical protein